MKLRDLIPSRCDAVCEVKGAEGERFRAYCVWWYWFGRCVHFSWRRV